MEEGEKSPSSSQNINNGCSESNPSAPSGSQNETQTATAHGPSKKMSVRDFEILYRVGKGAFGNVSDKSIKEKKDTFSSCLILKNILRRLDLKKKLLY